ncbi:MAG: LamG domain-containing protein [Thermofilum sp.]
MALAYPSFRTAEPLSPYLPENLRRGLVLYLWMNEGAGDRVYDLSGNGNHGTIYGATWTRLASGKSALHFDGVDDRVEVPDNPSNRLGDEGTLIAWTLWRGPTSKFQDVVRRHYILGWCVVGGVDFRAWIWDGNWRDFPYPSPYRTAMPQNKWVFQAFSYRYGDKAIVFVNGAVATYSAPYKPVLRATNWGIGWGGSDYSYEYFNGIIGMVLIYSRALSDAEIRALYNLHRGLFVG